MTRCGRPRPTARTPRRCSAGSPGRPRRSASARGSSRCPARSPAMTAMTAATIDQLSDGRMILGIGSSGPQVAEGWHGQRFAKQLQRTREYVAVVRMALARERVEFHGETLELPLPDGPGKALKLTIAPGAGAHPDLPRGDRPEEHGAGRRDRRRLDPDAVLPRARLRAAPAAGGGRGALGQIARRLRHRADGQRVHHRRPARRRATRCARSSRCTSAGWARASRTSTTSSSSATASRRRPRRSRTSTSKASARRRWRRSPTR